MIKSKRKEDYKKELREKWIKFFEKEHLRYPSHDEIVIWNYGFNHGYKARKERTLDLLKLRDN